MSATNLTDSPSNRSMPRFPLLAKRMGIHSARFQCSALPSTADWLESRWNSSATSCSECHSANWSPASESVAPSGDSLIRWAASLFLSSAPS